MNILFVCSANKLRSPTAEFYFAEHFPEVNFKSAGVNKKTCMKEGTTILTEEMLDWADKVFVMESKHKKIIRTYSNGKNMKKIIVLNIPDKFEFYDNDLIELLLERTEGHF